MAGIDENHVDHPNNAQAIAGDQPQDLQNHNIQDIPQQVAQPRVRRTHKDDFISSLLSKLSLREKLSKNKEIEDQNKNRELKIYNHYIDPVSVLGSGPVRFFSPKMGNRQPQPRFRLLILGATATEPTKTGLSRRSYTGFDRLRQ
jgi:hypothetical protein